MHVRIKTRGDLIKTQKRVVVEREHAQICHAGFHNDTPVYLGEHAVW